MGKCTPDTTQRRDGSAKVDITGTTPALAEQRTVLVLAGNRLPIVGFLIDTIYLNDSLLVMVCGNEDLEKLSTNELH